MLIIPFDRPIDWKNPPFVTFALVLINSFVFFFIQHGEQAAYDSARDYYYDSGLAAIELPRIKALLEDSDEEWIRQLEEVPIDEPSPWFEVAIYEADVLQAIYSHQLLKSDHPDYRQWIKQRQQLEGLLNNITTYGHGLRPAVPEWTDTVSHYFLHASTMHLIGNMFFLITVGFLIEGVLGHGRYLLAYMLMGLGAAAFDLIFDSQRYTPGIGASGAIAGLMGLYTVLYGRRRVQFFFNFFIYFDVRVAPAILLLPFWLGYELYNLALTSSNVNYLAHAGGLISGTALGGLLLKYRSDWLQTDFMDHRQQRAEEQDILLRAQSLEKSLDFKGAAVHYHKLWLAAPSIETLAALFRCGKNSPQSPAYASALNGALSSNMANQNRPLCASIFLDFLDKNWSKNDKPKLSNEQYQAGVKLLLDESEVQAADKLIAGMLKHSKHFDKAPQLAMQLSLAYKKQKNQDRAELYLKAIQKYCPQSLEARNATVALESFTNGD